LVETLWLPPRHRTGAWALPLCIGSLSLSDLLA
jgi:hypothetical protein